MATNVKRDDLIELRGAFAKGPGDSILFDHAGVRVILERRLVEIDDATGVLRIARALAKQKGLV